MVCLPPQHAQVALSENSSSAVSQEAKIVVRDITVYRVRDVPPPMPSSAKEFAQPPPLHGPLLSRLGFSWDEDCLAYPDRLVYHQLKYCP